MLKFDLDPLFKIRAINKKTAFLYKNGFSKSKAATLVNSKFKSISIKNIELLCRAFNCTPNDLFTFDESASNPLPADSALKSIIKKPIPSVSEIVKDLSVSDAAELIANLEKFKPRQ
jgi:DNA-binding Xre family transcriptional regulator